MGDFDFAPDARAVEYRPLWSLTVWNKRFSGVAAEKQRHIEPTRAFMAKDVDRIADPNGDVKILTTSESELYTNDELAGGAVEEGEVVAIPGGGSPNIQYYKGRFVSTDNRIARCADGLDCRYLYHVLLSRKVEIAASYRGAGIKHPDMAKVLNMSIPVPPMEVQREIVRVLDTFTGVAAELEAELEARKLQYAHYRDELLDFPRKGVDAA